MASAIEDVGADEAQLEAEQQDDQANEEELIAIEVHGREAQNRRAFPRRRAGGATDRGVPVVEIDRRTLASSGLPPGWRTCRS